MSNKSSNSPLLKLAMAVKAELDESKIAFALAGAIVADLYRAEPRATADIDVLVAISEDNVAEASRIVEKLGFTARIATQEMLRGDTRFPRRARRGTPQIVVGRSAGRPYGLDLLLLTLPWAARALERSRSSLINFPGLGPIPCLTVEDLLISKLFALKNSSVRRYKSSDLPDIVLIFEHNSKIDWNYLSDRMSELELVLPKIVERIVPASLARISRKFRKKVQNVDY